MSGENVSFPAGNFSGDRTNTNFYSFSNGIMLAKQRTAPYSLVSSYPVNTYVSGSVDCVQFDGYYYWSLEDQTSGFTIKKWELDSGVLWQRGIYSFSGTSPVRYDSDCFIVDSYNDSVGSAGGSAGSLVLPVSDVSVFELGDNIVIGPSTHSSFSDEYEKRKVVGKTSSSLILDSALQKSFLQTDPIYTSRYFYIFNKYSPYDQSKGSLLKYNIETGNLYSYSSSHMFANIKASCFYEDYIYFIKGNEIIQLNPITMLVFRHFSIDNLKSDRANIVPIYGMWIYDDVLYRLQDTRVYYDDGIDEWAEEGWDPYYNYISEGVPTIYQTTVYFVKVDAYPRMIHAVATGIPTTESEITVTVFNQDRVPLSDRSVSVTSSRGSLSPNSGTTDSNGQFVCTYNGTSHVEEIEIQATVT